MDDIALSPRSQLSSSSLTQTQHLCEEWENAWAKLGACNGSQDSDINVEQPLQHHTSFCRRIYALVDLPNTRNHTAVLQTAQKRLAALVKQIPPPHIPLASDEFRLLRFEPTDCQQVARRDWRRLQCRLLLLGTTDAATKTRNREWKACSHL
jgi:hypothetical protein